MTDIAPSRPMLAPADAARDLQRVERLARLLDARFRIPGTPIRFGLDGIVGLVPGVGDTVTLIPSVWMIATAWRHGAGGGMLARMGLNTAIDYVIGAIPLVGDLFDIGFKANLRNAALLREHLAPATTVAPSVAAEAAPRYPHRRKW